MPPVEHDRAILAGGGEMGALIRAHDWSTSPLGPPEGWPQPLRLALQICLNMPIVSAVHWGSDLCILYNDAYAPALAERHPWALGRPFGNVWPEIWNVLGPQIASVVETGCGFSTERQLLKMDRHGHLEDTYWIYSFSPIRDDAGSVGGVFVTALDETEMVLAERRQAFILTLGDRLRSLDDAGEIMQAAAEALGREIGADRAGYAEVAADDRTFVVERDWSDGNMASFIGRHHLDDFGPDLIAAFRGGQTVNFEDVLAEALTAGEAVAEAFETITMRGAITVPLIKGGRFAAALYAHSRSPRKWTQGDEALVREVAERTWSAVERARAEAGLRDSEARFRALATVGSSSLYRMSPDWREMRGLDGAGFLVDTDAPTTDWIDKYIPADERSRVRKAIGRAISAKTLFEFEHRVLRADDTVGWTLSRAIPVLDDAGDIIEWFGAASDVTERVKADQSFSRLFQASPAPFLVLAADAPRFTIKEVNDAYLAATMTTRESIVGCGVFEAFPDNPDDPTIEGVSTLRASLERVLATHEPDALPGLKYDIARPDGSFEERWWSPVNSAVLDESGGVEAIIHNANDVTEERRVAAALRESESRLRELNETLESRVVEALAERRLLADVIDGTDIFVQVADREFNWLAINQAASDEFARIFGVRRPRAGDNMLEMLAHRPDDRQAVEAVWSRALAGEEFVEIDEFGDPSQSRGHYEMRFRTLRDANGRATGAYQFVSDVTARLQEQARLRDAEEALRQSQKMEAMGSLTGGVAHDFNNLLTPIIGSLDMLQRKGLGNEREQRLIAGALQSADRAKTLVQRLLAFARRQPLQATAVDLTPLVQGMADLISSTTGPQIKVVVDAAEGLPPANADPNQLEMAILNLAVNARDAMPDGGTLRISVDAESVGPQHRTDLSPGRYLRLSVADTGDGMDEATLKRAVEPFFSTKGVGKGTGLGLSMVHGLASQLGGALTIRSTRGIGTHIEFWLPQSVGSIASTAYVVETELLTKSSGTALLVDDEEIVRMSTADMLSELGYTVVEAASAEEAFGLVDRGLQLDLLVTDHLMPGMSGTELARTLQNSHPRVKVLVISGYAEAEGIAPDLPRLTKPFRNADLAASLAELTRST